MNNVFILKKQFGRWKTWQEASTKRRIFASYFGTGEVVDAFLIAFLLPTFAINFFEAPFLPQTVIMVAGDRL